MERQRVVSVVEAPWGRSTVYDPETIEATSVSVVQVKSKIEEIEQSYLAQESSQRIITNNTSEVKTDADCETQDQTIKDPFEREMWCLPYFRASLFATVLEDTITQFRILVECNTEMRISKTMSDMGLLRALKYGVEQPEVSDELEGIDHRNLGCIEYKLNKLNVDRNYFGEVLVKLYVDLSLNRCFKALNQYVNQVAEREKYRNFLIEDEAKNRLMRRELYKQLRQQRIHVKSVIYDADVVIDDLKTQVEDASLMAETRGRYVANWQHARTEQHHQTIHENECVFTNSIEVFKQRSDHEQRVHSEVELLTNIIINETLQKVEEWMEKYDKDIEKIDLNIQIKRTDYQTMLEKRTGIQNTIRKHDLAMKAWNEFKEEREKARKYVETMTKSAIIVQAWWRGLLVRKQLGPYRPPKKRGGAAKKK